MPQAVVAFLVLSGLSALLFVSYTAAAVHWKILSFSQFLPAFLVAVLRLAGALALAAGAAVYAASMRALGVQTALGREKDLVTGGIYRYIRNPLYAGVGMIMAGLGLAVDMPWLAAASVLFALAVCFKCLVEEKDLARRFGAGYEEYRKNTPMLIPDFGRMLRDLKNRKK